MLLLKQNVPRLFHIGFESFWTSFWVSIICGLGIRTFNPSLQVWIAFFAAFLGAFAPLFWVFPVAVPGRILPILLPQIFVSFMGQPFSSCWHLYVVSCTLPYLFCHWQSKSHVSSEIETSREVWICRRRSSAFPEIRKCLKAHWVVVISDLGIFDFDGRSKFERIGSKKLRMELRKRNVPFWAQTLETCFGQTNLSHNEIFHAFFRLHCSFISKFNILNFSCQEFAAGMIQEMGFNPGFAEPKAFI